MQESLKRFCAMRNDSETFKKWQQDTTNANASNNLFDLDEFEKGVKEARKSTEFVVIVRDWNIAWFDKDIDDIG
ncbi:hypothetical protein RFI_00378 [Reticulomyxa filosa]|uniref:Uncharacterized protein n=1 Tax=Reticulomyxa filosa TaxID=46433 RepID=X6PF50_RETFI|nr:hypothetical protein RFI_00378 [Reticulomyxa filosa]|eukprot:ETO36684.1 hypothetical protein RFI_00378 [Reticulomyxa filosa]